MNKEDLLIKSYSVLSKNICSNSDALVSAIKQLFEINPKLGMDIWEKTIRDNITEISKDFGKDSFEYSNPGYTVIWKFEYNICSEKTFKNAVELYSKNTYLLDVNYSRSPIYEIFHADKVISYLIRTNHLQEAENILSALYKNKSFNNYSKFWDHIIKNFEYGLEYDSCIVNTSLIKQQPEQIRQFCLSWIERIKDEEQQAGAMTFALQMY